MKASHDQERYAPYRLVQSLYDRTLSRWLPTRVGVYNGVAVRDRGFLDRTDEQPEYESALVAALRRHLHRGEDVVVIGGGRGVSAVVAARIVGPGGSATVYEGGTEQFERTKETIELNRVGDWTTVEHALVGPGDELYDEAGDARAIDPDELPECDALVMDCEGAEEAILEALSVRPRLIIVETHGFLGVPESKVETMLGASGYEVFDHRAEYPEKGVSVLSARRMADQTE